MTNKTKRTKSFQEMFDKNKAYTVEKAVSILKEAPKTNFDQTVGISMKLNLLQTSDPIRGTLSLPNGTGQEIDVLVFCKGDKVKEAEQAGADFVGSDDLIARISEGWLDFDSVVATPDMMKEIARLGKTLGPRGLMPNPKAGTVTNDIAKVVKELKSGKIEFKMDKLSGVKAPVGKLSFKEEALCENIQHFVVTVLNSNNKLHKPANVGTIYISSTMGPGVKLDSGQFRAML